MKSVNVLLGKVRTADMPFFSLWPRQCDCLTFSKFDCLVGAADRSNELIHLVTWAIPDVSKSTKVYRYKEIHCGVVSDSEKSKSHVNVRK